MVTRGQGGQRRQFLTPTQRILLWHIAAITPALALSLLGDGWYGWSGLASLTVTVWTVRRLLVHRSLRILVTRSLEPGLIIVGAILYVWLVSNSLVMPLWQQGFVLIAAFMLQLRYFLQQFRVETVRLQSVFSITLIILMNTVWALLATINALAGFVTLVLVWLVNYIIVHYWLERVGFHNSFLAAVWALIATEAMWLTSIALVFYTVPRTAIMVSRSAIFLAVIAYAWGSMLMLHSRRKLTKRLVVEYGVVCTAVLLALLVFSGW